MNYPGAISQPGPAAKVNGGVNTCRGVVMHSMVGPYLAALGELVNPARRASWHYSVLRDGRVLAHYPDEAQTWHAGSAYNNSTIGIEHEGGLNPHNEPLTPVQLAASVSLVRWLAKAHGFPLVRGKGLYEHNEVSGEPTACPSKRIPWAAYAAQPEEEDEMKSFLAWCDAEKKVYFVSPAGAKWIPGDGSGAGPVFAELERVFGPMKIVLSPAAINAIGVRP